MPELDRQAYYSTQDTDADDEEGEENMPKAGTKLPWRLTFQYATQDKPANHAHYTREDAERAADETLESARRNESSVTLTITNRETGESYTYPKENETVAAPKKDVDEKISDVRTIIDEIAAIDPKSEGAAEKAKDAYDRAEKVIRTLPADKRTTLRTDLRAARDSVVNAGKPADNEAPANAATPAGTVAVRQADDPMEIEGVPELAEQAIKAFKDGVKYGLKLSEVGETVARTMLEMRLKMTHQGLPDLLSIEKRTKNAAAKVYDTAREGVAKTDTKTNDAHDALQKAVQNKMGDVLVGWLRDFGSSPDADEALETARLFFPEAAERVEDAKRRKDEGEEVSDAELNLTEAIYAVYAEKGIELPRYGRTEIQRFNYRVKQLDTTRKELDAVRDELDDEELPQDRKEELTAKVTELEEKAKGITEEIPAEWLEKATPEKTPRQRAEAKVERAMKLTDSVRKAVKKLEGADRQEVSGRLVTLGSTLLVSATRDADKLSDDEKADLKAQISALVTTLAAEAAKL
jgi:hypothetical protein